VLTANYRDNITNRSIWYYFCTLVFDHQFRKISMIVSNVLLHVRVALPATTLSNEELYLLLSKLAFLNSSYYFFICTLHTNIVQIYRSS